MHIIYKLILVKIIYYEFQEFGSAFLIKLLVKI